MKIFQIWQTVVTHRCRKCSTPQKNQNWGRLACLAVTFPLICGPLTLLPATADIQPQYFPLMLHCLELHQLEIPDFTETIFWLGIPRRLRWYKFAKWPLRHALVESGCRWGGGGASRRAAEGIGGLERGLHQNVRWVLERRFFDIKDKLYLFKILAQFKPYLEENRKKCFLSPLYLPGPHDHFLPRPSTKFVGTPNEQFSCIKINGFPWHNGNETISSYVISVQRCTWDANLLNVGVYWLFYFCHCCFVLFF